MNLIRIPRKRIQIVLMVISSLVLVTGMTWFIQSATVKAYLPDMSSAQSRYPNIVGSRIDSCSLCHTSAPSLNPYGAAYKAAGRSPAALAAIEPLDSDGDGFTNLQEIMALYFPGNSADHPPAVTATTAPPTPTRTPTSVPPTATRTPTSVPPTATRTAVPPTPTNTATNPPPTATRTTVPPTPTNTATNLPPTATRTVAPPTGTAVPPTATNTAVPPTVTNTVPPPPAATQTPPPPPTATNTAPPPPTATNTAPPPPTATQTPLPPTAPPPLPTATKMATQAPTIAFTATSTAAVGETEEPNDDDRKEHHATPTRGAVPTRRPSPTPPCGYYRVDGRSSSQGWSGFSGSDGDRGSLYRKCSPHKDDSHDFVSRFVTQAGDFLSQIFSFFK